MVELERAIHEFNFQIDFYEGNHCTTPGETAILLQELKRYRDTGLEPDQVQAYADCKMGPMTLTAIMRADELHKFADWEDADKDGRLVVLPCKVGDTVFVTYGKKYKPYVVDRIHIIGNQEIQVRMRAAYCCTETLWLSASKFGKTVFLADPEAEAVAKEAPSE